MSSAGKKLKYMAVTSVVTVEIKNRLREIFDGDDPAQLAATPLDDICERLEEGGFNPDDPSHPLPEIALAIINRLGGAPEDQPKPSLSKESPSEGESTIGRLVTVVGEALAGKKQLHEFTTSELLDMLTEGKFGRFQIAEVIGAFRAKHDVGTAHARANGVLIVVNANGTVRKDDTLAYIDQLQRPFAPVLEEFKGKEITTLDRAFKRKNMVAINYLTTPWSIEQIGTVNQFGYDLGELIDRFTERAKMVAWAAATSHETMQDLPTSKYGLKGIFKELFRETLEDERFTDMRRAYKRAVNRGDLATQTIILKMTEEQALASLHRGSYATQASAAPQRPAEPVRNEAWYEAEVRKHASLKSPNITIGNYNTSISGRICRRLTINAYSVTVANTVVLDGGSVNKYSCNVNVICPPGVEVHDNSYSNHVEVDNRTWEGIYNYLGLGR